MAAADAQEPTAFPSHHNVPLSARPEPVHPHNVSDPALSVRLELDLIESRIRRQVEPNIRKAMRLVFYLTELHLSKREIMAREGWDEGEYRFLWRKVAMAMTPGADE